MQGTIRTHDRVLPTASDGAVMICYRRIASETLQPLLSSLQDCLRLQYDGVGKYFIIQTTPKKAFNGF